MTTLAVIPARYASTRLPAKPLLDLGGQPMIQRVYEAVSTCKDINRVIVATDDERIQQAVRSFGGEVVLTQVQHPSGTDRVAEVAASLPEAQWVINVQGDEPFIQPSQISAVVQALKAGARIATLGRIIDTEEALFSPHVVKLVRNEQGQALYFSRHPIPYLRQLPQTEWLAARQHIQHLGLYGFQRKTLLELTQLPPAPLEQAESLEQLRWLAAGHAIKVALTEQAAFGIDTPEDLELARQRLG
ncbi:MAG: 3-deoxy-manno-octulosonate cytidylyltransferase [Bacteroidota bacterium]